MQLLVLMMISSWIFHGSCVWPTPLETEPNAGNTEPRIDRSRTEPLFEDTLLIPQVGELPPELEMKLAVWEPNLQDDVKLRVYIDYDPENPSAAVYARDITNEDALTSDPQTRVIFVRNISPCTEETPPNTVKMVDFVIAAAWDDDVEEPEYRAALSGHTDEVRIAVTCLAP